MAGDNTQAQPEEQAYELIYEAYQYFTAAYFKEWCDTQARLLFWANNIHPILNQPHNSSKNSAELDNRSSTELNIEQQLKNSIKPDKQQTILTSCRKNFYKRFSITGNRFYTLISRLLECDMDDLSLLYQKAEPLCYIKTYQQIFTEELFPQYGIYPLSQTQTS